MKEKLVVIVGPTAVGKTKTSIELAKAINGEIISGDSMQVYRGLDVGTAKVTEDEMEGIPHYMIDIKDPTEPFSVAEFQERAKELITTINNKGKIPIIVGGTGLYIRSVTHHYEFSEANKNSEIRDKLQRKADLEGTESLHQELKSIDPERAAEIHPNNIHRVIRALEIYYETGSIPSKEQKMMHGKEEPPYHLALVGLTMDRQKLFQRINERVDLMVESGLIEEAKWLLKQDISNSLAAKAIGYKELFPYLNGESTLEESIELLKRNSRRYAKRQFTWFNNQMDVQWFFMDESSFEKKFKEIRHFVEGKLDISENV
ncbi:tRNA (adenosine(37)-N6)-dimethylallyltransferase MiaA [Fictibacillus phosphorivorans]|uniref:tRNA (adenosine(37)-N6)-dimethylallyltransferase MiaA n=1 Tax=Fictibacillus phosphorivorans TaxID=1221500 RepID=UPI002040123D|nr:tRNA (adenosine(37)-N6)-dimethylallyltransferase MiaA [Fictibacillus phosphorivorans]MCM3717075.1 tRNA (adenosine(37)-N6)-dimethylallyltransferase MiaA [Fictibacillus phosphorivorans]MCM3774762.1 tRNA (adenosine(37)-N6)-dimethylallyltransferase MiaA [Fictibacillus phosphorivorans]